MEHMFDSGGGAGSLPHKQGRITGDQTTGVLLGAQLVGRRSAEVAKRVDTYATALFHGMIVDGLAELNLSHTPPLGSPWDATQVAAQTWSRGHRFRSSALVTRPGLSGTLRMAAEVTTRCVSRCSAAQAARTRQRRVKSWCDR